MADDSPTILRPRPLRPFEIDSKSSGSNSPSGFITPSREPSDPTKLSAERDERGNLLSRTRSVLNLTSSTLFGIYAPGTDEGTTPMGVGAQTPMRASIDDHRPPIIGAFEGPDPPSPPPTVHRQSFVSLGIRAILLFLTGIAYGLIISAVHHTERIAPIKIDAIERWSWSYLLGWGGTSVLLGALLPWVDRLWAEVFGDSKYFFPPRQQLSKERTSIKEEDSRPSSSSNSRSEPMWNPAVRSITAFVGIAFAIRRLPWQSTLQVSLTLALVNPVLWYLFDRSKTGFLFSSIVGIAGTIIALGVNPAMVPSPATPSPQIGTMNPKLDEILGLDGRVSVERIGVGTWIASVLFCSSLCFGNVGRRLTLESSNK